MKNVWMLKTVLYLGIIVFSAEAFAGELVRVYCRPDGNVIIESDGAGNYTEENKISEYPSRIVDRDSFPPHKYIGQIRCNGQALVADNNYKPEWVLREEQIRQNEAALDFELDKNETDIVAVLKLQRSIEKLKQGKIDLRHSVQSLNE